MPKRESGGRKTVTLLSGWTSGAPVSAVVLGLGAGALLAAGLSLSYLVLPIVHHLFATPAGYRYITATSDFLAPNLGVQTMAPIMAAAMALGFARARQTIQLSLRPAIR